MRFETEVLLGADKDGNLVFGKFGYIDSIYYDKCGIPRSKGIKFVASFNTNMPFQVKDGEADRLFERYAQSIIDNSDKATLYDLCSHYECSPLDLRDEIVNDTFDIRDAYDCSTFTECYMIDDNEWYFLSCAGGQHDTRKPGMMEYTNKEVYDKIHELWDAFHLKVMDSETLKMVKEFMDECENLRLDDENWMKEWISDYIHRNKEILEDNEPY